MATNPYSELVSELNMNLSKKLRHDMQNHSAELGRITTTGLKLEGFKHEIQDYHVADWSASLTIPFAEVSCELSGFSGTVGGEGKITLREAKLEEVEIHLKDGLKPGDQVLAVPVHNGNEAVILCKVVK